MRSSCSESCGSTASTSRPPTARCSCRIDGQDVTESIRDPDLTAKVRHVAAAPRVREQLVTMQRAFAARHDKIVTEGRDQGTVVFPDARVKFYLTADPAERARRRAAELQAKGAAVDMEQIRQAIEARDKSDENRAVGPLKPAQDAIMIDTTGSSIEEVVERMYRCVEEQPGPGSRAAPRDPALRQDAGRQRFARTGPMSRSRCRARRPPGTGSPGSCARSSP